MTAASRDQPGPAPVGLGAGYWRMFAADTVSSIGTVVSTLAIQFLLIDTLKACLLYTSDAADERSSVDLGGRPII